MILLRQDQTQSSPQILRFTCISQQISGSIFSMKLDVNLYPDRLVLPADDEISLAQEWRNLCVSPRRRIVLPQDVTVWLTSLSSYCGGSALAWFEASLLIDLRGRLFLESTCPLSRWLRPSHDLDTRVVAECSLPEHLVRLIQRAENCNDSEIGLAIRRRLELQMVGQEVPEYLTRAIDASWLVDDTFLTVWLPDKAAADVKAFALHVDLTLSDVLRNTMFLRLWGRTGLEQCVHDGRWRKKRRSDVSSDSIFYSNRLVKVPDNNVEAQPEIKWTGEESSQNESPRRVERIAEHGKSPSAYKFWLPSAMKDLLHLRAQALGLRDSDYCRDVVLQAFYGHR